ncbi:MAG: transglutaminase domain-containing protein [Desulfovibrionaceae bacterium]|nr:transglutaminase domain-containing protein [Desulfovibrionaceae bacterium]
MRKLLLCFAFLGLILGLILGLGTIASADPGKKSGTVTYDINLKVAPNSKTANVYLPYPLSDKNQDIKDVKVSGNFSSQGVYRDVKTGSYYLMASWDAIKEQPKMTFSFHVDSHYKKGQALKDVGEKAPVDVAPYLAANDYIPADSKHCKDIVKEVCKDMKTTLQKVRALYDWTIANTYRDPNVKGCGLGDAIRTLTEAQGGGKCADISSVFITLCRSAGIPCRDVFGLRIKGQDGAITGDFHCWAEFYLPGTGWVQADPADVRKAMLIEKLELKDAATKKHIEFFWNGDDLFRIALNRGEHAAKFMGMQGEAIGYFMYPYAEVDGKGLDYFAPKDFSFAVNFKAD